DGARAAGGVLSWGCRHIPRRGPPRRSASHSTATAGCTRRRCWRMLAYNDDGGRVKLVSRNGRDHTRPFRDIAVAVSKLSARTLVLDGEVAIFDQQFRSRFDWLREPEPDAVATPPMFIAFRCCSTATGAS